MARAVSNQTKIANTVIAGTLGFLMFFPILWIVILSFKTEGDAIKAPLEVLFGTGWTTESFGAVQARSNYFKHFMNSVIISVGSTFLGLLIAVPAAWAMAFVPAYLADRSSLNPSFSFQKFLPFTRVTTSASGS